MNGLSPLDCLLRKIQTIPSLSALESLFEDSGLTARFIQLIDEYLPGHKAEILNKAETGDKIGEFFYFFQQEYFELDDSWVQEIFENGGDFGDEDGKTHSLYEGLVEFLPAVMRGFRYSWYHEVTELQEGYQLLLALLECPAEYQPCRGGVGTPRLAVVDNAAFLAGKELATRIPKDGFSPDKLKKLCRGTKYQALADFSSWVSHSTGLLIIDADPEDYDKLSWERAIVDRIKREEPAAQKLEKSWSDLAGWLEEDVVKNFSELLGFLLGKKIELKTSGKKELDEKAKNKKRAAR